MEVVEVSQAFIINHEKSPNFVRTTKQIVFPPRLDFNEIFSRKNSNMIVLDWQSKSKIKIKLLMTILHTKMDCNPDFHIQQYSR